MSPTEIERWFEAFFEEIDKGTLEAEDELGGATALKFLTINQ